MGRPRADAPRPPDVGPGRLALTDGAGRLVGVALVDEDVYELLRGYRIWVDAGGYPALWYAGRKIRLHRLITGEPQGVDVDHDNGNKLDNRRSNLIVGTHQWNILNRGRNKNNTSGFRGVSYDARTGRWAATLKVGEDKYWLGRHDTKEEAARAWDLKALEVLGPRFRKTNFPREDYQ